MTDFEDVNFERNLAIDFLSIQVNIILELMPEGLSDCECLTAPSHYLC